MPQRPLHRSPARFAKVLAPLVGVTLGLGAALSTAGCQRKDAVPDCNAASVAYAKLVKQQVEKDHADNQDLKARALSLLPSLKAEMVQACTAQGWSEAARRCITSASSSDDLSRCDTKPASTPDTKPASAPDTNTETGGAASAPDTAGDTAGAPAPAVPESDEEKPAGDAPSTPAPSAPAPIDG